MIGCILSAGAFKLPVKAGMLYVFQCGLVFVSRPTKLHILHLPTHIGSLTLQDLELPGSRYPALGPCVALKGKVPACGLPPTCHLTDNPYLVLPLRFLSEVSTTKLIHVSSAPCVVAGRTGQCSCACCACHALQLE